VGHARVGPGSPHAHLTEAGPWRLRARCAAALMSHLVRTVFAVVGGRFDNAIREVVEGAAGALCQWLLGGEEPAEVHPLATALAASPIEADSVFRSVRAEPPVRRDHLIRHAATLANVYLPRSTLETILRRWTDMPVDLRELPMVQEAMAEGRAEGFARGLAEGRAEGRAEGQVEGRAAVLLRLLEARFGALTPARVDAVTSLPAEALDELAVAVLGFGVIADLDDWLVAASDR
jgi:predicted transposase YdaD